jgi:hypothetical protein
MTLAFPDPDKRICVLTNASDRFYAVLVTQIHEEQLDLDERARPPASGFFVRPVPRLATAMNSTGEERFRNRRHIDKGRLPVAKS